jgi:hypothetical protein
MPRSALRGRGLRRTALLLLALSPLPSPADGLYFRDLTCEKQAQGRAREICEALERALVWTWTGHAIISPSFRTQIHGVKRIYCSLPVTPDDTGTLVDMAVRAERGDGMAQAQLAGGLSALLSMLGQEAVRRFPAPEGFADERDRIVVRYLKAQLKLAIAEDSTSIFSPAHPSYVLRDGCS